MLKYVEVWCSISWPNFNTGSSSTAILNIFGVGGGGFPPRSILSFLEFCNRELDSKYWCCSIFGNDWCTFGRREKRLKLVFKVNQGVFVLFLFSDTKSSSGWVSQEHPGSWDAIDLFTKLPLRRDWAASRFHWDMHIVCRVVSRARRYAVHKAGSSECAHNGERTHQQVLYMHKGYG